MDEKDKGVVFEEVRKQAHCIHLLGLSTDTHSPKALGGSLADVYVVESPSISQLGQKVAAVLQPKTGNSLRSQKEYNHPT
jgi:hypothetical protein